MLTDKPIAALSEEQRAHAEARYRETMTNENRPRRDDAITPFFIGMQLAGFVAASSPGGCDVLSTCPKCRSNYRGLFENANGQQWACPICNTLTPHAKPTDQKPVPQHVFDYLKANARLIPRDVVSLYKLIALEGWNVTAEQLTAALARIDNE
jgi:hypothetical protein